MERKEKRERLKTEEKRVKSAGMSSGNGGKQMEDDELLELKFLVRCENSKGKMEFHLVDLRKKDLWLNYFRSINACEGNGDMLMHQGMLFILGSDYGQDPADLKNDNTKKHTHKGASIIHIGLVKHIPTPLNLTICNPSAVDGCVCCFGFPYLRPAILSFSEGIWENVSLPDHLQDRSVSPPIVPDHANSRFLVHLYDDEELYAFYPPDDEHQHGDWQLLSYSGAWTNVVAVADGILFFHEWNFPTLLCAYDLNANKWLNVVPDLSRVDITMRVFYSMFTLPAKGIICLASMYSPMDGSSSTVYFLKLKFDRMGPSELKLTALDYLSYPLPSLSHFVDFVML